MKTIDKFAIGSIHAKGDVKIVAAHVFVFTFQQICYCMCLKTTLASTLSTT